ncbi:MAG: hypothetical protein CVU64_17555 [Deltaproteobacteria bacterium HGW-Deltaproteobacteria-21]|nr:MAG: hypothetical protein CVU64_17555 [Deltaproteobacteria bacterium HGW-Deltaproteobacteria-21]
MYKKVRASTDRGAHSFVFRQDPEPKNHLIDAQKDLYRDLTFRSILDGDSTFPKMLVVSPHRRGFDSGLRKTVFNIPTFVRVVTLEPFGDCVAEARNFAIYTALRKSFPYLCFIDDDLRIQPNSIFCLLNHLLRGFDVVSGTYAIKRDPFRLNVLVQSPGEAKRFLTEHDIEAGRVITENLKLPAMGLSVWRTDVFNRLTPPYCRELRAPLTGRMVVCEDEYIFKRLLELDPPIKLAVDCSPECHALHIGQDGKVWGLGMDHQVIQPLRSPPWFIKRARDFLRRTALSLRR